MRTQQLVASVTEHVVLILTIAIIGMIAAAMLAQGQSATYESTARIAIGPAETIADENDRIQVGHVLNQGVVPANLSELLVSRRVLATALVDSGLLPSEVEDDEIAATVAPDSNIVYLSIVSSDSARPVQLIAPLTQAGVDLFEEIYSVYRAEVIQLDVTPEETKPLSPVVGAIIGLIIALVVAVYLAMLIDNTNAGRTERRRRRIGDSIRSGAPDIRPDVASSSVWPKGHDGISRPDTQVSSPLISEARQRQSPSTTGEFVVVDEAGTQRRS